jgi:hypothetical protein
MEACKFCGADLLVPQGPGLALFDQYRCGTIKKYLCGTLVYACEWERSDRCHASELAASEARARELWEALELVEMTRYTDDFHWAEIMAKVGQQVNKHADHFGKESEATNEIH